MLKPLKKKKQPKIKISAPETDQIVCGACNHVRKETDKNPEWQCPGCGKAYSKTRSTPQSVKQQREPITYEETMGQETKNNIWYGLATGAFTLYSGLARTVASCARPAVQTFVPANPFLQFLGVVIIAATLIYAAYKYLN